MIHRQIWAAIGYRRPISHFSVYRQLLEGKHGLEIGGPSAIFARRNRLPLYPLIGSLDGCNFSHSTLWEPSLEQGQNYVYDNRKASGYQFIRDAVDISDIPAQTYDFVLSSHSLEHVANPLRALAEWRRVLKPSGALLLILPNKHATFDHRRPVTQFAHLLDDFSNNVQEDDLTHVPEILELHDLSMDRAAGSPQAFKERSLNNLQYRGMHHHVFDASLIAEMLTYVGMSIITSDSAPPFHLITLAQRVGRPQLDATLADVARVGKSAPVRDSAA